MRSAGASDVERETRMLSEQILERMRAVFGAFLRGPGSWQRDRAAG
jgi:hypothetical protein